MIIKANKPSCMNRLENTKNKLYFNVVYISPLCELSGNLLRIPFFEFLLQEIIEKNYHIPGNPASDGDLDLEEIGWGRGGG